MSFQFLVFLVFAAVASLLFLSEAAERNKRKRRKGRNSRSSEKSANNNKSKSNKKDDNSSSLSKSKNNTMKYQGYINGRDKRAKVPEQKFAEKLAELDEDQLKKLKEYLGIRAPSPDNLDYVYACPNCHVRITNMSDMIRSPVIWDKTDLRSTVIDTNAVFKWTTNLTEKKGKVHCYRCDYDFGFAYRPDDRKILTIPMLKKNFECTLLKREFRLLCFVFGSKFSQLIPRRNTTLSYEKIQPKNMWTDMEVLKENCRFRDEFEKINQVLVELCEGKCTTDEAGNTSVQKIFSTTDIDKRHYEFYRDESILKKLIELDQAKLPITEKRQAVLNQIRPKRKKKVPGQSEPKPKPNPKPKVLPNNFKHVFGEDSSTYDEKIRLLNEAYEDLGFTICMWRDIENQEALRVPGMSKQDSTPEPNDMMTYAKNTYDLAVYFRTPSTQNVHPENSETDYWGILSNAEKVHLICWALSGGNFMMGLEGQGLYDKENIDFYSKAKLWFSETTTNSQPAFSKLILDGHYLGFFDFKQGEVLSSEKKNKLKNAFEGKQLFPDWLFLHDYPKTVMNKELRYRYLYSEGELSGGLNPIQFVPYAFYDRARELCNPSIHKFISPEDMNEDDESPSGFGDNYDAEIREIKELMKKQKSSSLLSSFRYSFNRKNKMNSSRKKLSL